MADAPADPVLVVGAGPVGLTAALALHARGLPVTVLEADPENRIRPGSRALFVHRESLRLLELASPGLGAAIARHGVTWQTRRTLYRGRQVYERSFPPPPEHALPPFASLRQVETERFLLAACVKAGVRVEWGADVNGAAVNQDGVALTTSDGREWTAAYAIAADGARSAVRRALAIPMSGARSKGCHVVVDVAELPHARLPSERVFHYEHPGVGGRTVLRVPFAGGFQVDLQCRDDDPPEAYGTADAVRQWLPSVIGDGYDDQILWVSTYQFLQVVADSFADPGRRILLVGEAAHLFPPFGARGMNSGIADAVAVAAGIAAALADPSRAAQAVDGYATTRRVAALNNSEAAGRALAHLRPGRAMRARQRAAAALVPMLPRLGSWLEHAPYGPRGLTFSTRY